MTVADLKLENKRNEIKENRRLTHEINFEEEMEMSR